MPVWLQHSRMSRAMSMGISRALSMMGERRESKRGKMRERRMRDSVKTLCTEGVALRVVETFQFVQDANADKEVKGDGGC